MARRSVAGRSGFRRRSPKAPEERPLQHFVKIIQRSNLQDKKLRLPKKFAKKYGDELCEEAEVVGPDGRSWRMRLTRDENHILFDGGCGAFMKHHSIDEGYIFVFRYKGSSNFSVLIFDRSGCEIQCSSSGPTNSDDSDESLEILDPKISTFRGGASKSVSNEDGSKGECSKRKAPLSKKTKLLGRVGSQENNPSLDHINRRGSEKCVRKLVVIDSDDSNESRKGVLGKHGVSSSPAALSNETKKAEDSSSEEEDEEYLEPVASGYSKAPARSKNAIHAARLFKPKHPSFMVLLRPYNFSNNHMYVPAGFATKYMTEACKYVRLRISDGRQWPLKVTRPELNHTTFGKGWHEFYRENKLQEGDVCVFELIKNKTFVLQVSIFRAIEDSST